MTRPVAGESTTRSHETLLLTLGALLLARGVLGLLDMWTLARSGIRFVPVGAGAIVGGSPVWAGLWAALCLAAAVLLVRRQAIGWLLAAGACAAYLVMGLGDAALFDSAATIPAGAWVLFLVDVAGPALVLALLISIRPWFLAGARRAGPPAHLTLPPTTDELPWEGAPMRAILERYRPRVGPLAESDVIGLGVATVDRERAAAELPGLAFRPAPDDELLGGRVLAAPLPSGRTLLLLEPSREGRLTAFLARHGEGWRPCTWPNRRPGRRRPTARPRRSGRSSRVIVLVASPAVPAGTIRP